MEGDELYQYIYHVKLELYERAQIIMEEIKTNGKSETTDNIPRSVHSIVASIHQEVNAKF